jgi:hypothetical protein
MQDAVCKSEHAHLYQCLIGLFRLHVVGTDGISNPSMPPPSFVPGDAATDLPDRDKLKEALSKALHIASSPRNLMSLSGRSSCCGDTAIQIVLKYFPAG